MDTLSVDFVMLLWHTGSKAICAKSVYTVLDDSDECFRAVGDRGTLIVADEMNNGGSSCRKEERGEGDEFFRL